MRSSPAILVGLFVLSCFGTTPATRASDSNAQLTLKAAFEKTAHFHGKPYQLAKGYLLRQPRNQLTKLMKQPTTDWRQHELALSLKWQFQHPQQTREFQLLHHSSHQSVEIQSKDSATLAFRTTDTQGNATQHKLTVDRTWLPILHDFVRECAPSSYSSDSSALTLLIQLLDHFGDPKSANVIVDHWVRHPSKSGKLDELIVKLGAHSAPPLRALIRKAPVKSTDSGDSRTRSRQYHEIRDSIRAAQLLARIGDRESIPILSEKLAQTPLSKQAITYAQALAAMNHSADAQRILSLLVDASALMDAEHDKRFEVFYSDVRATAMQFADELRPLLRQMIHNDQPIVHQAIGRGLLFELDYPNKANAVYQQLGIASEQALKSNGMTSRFFDRDNALLDASVLGRKQCWNPHLARTFPVLPGSTELPEPMLLERAVGLAIQEDIRTLARKNDSLSLQIVQQSLMKGKSDARQVLIPLAAARGDRSVGVIKQILEKNRSSVNVKTVVEALFLIGGEQSTALLKRIIRESDQEKLWPKNAADLAKQLLPALNDRDRIAQLLTNKENSVRLVAARRLVAKNDLRAIPVLFRQALHSKGSRFDEIVALLVDLGPAASERISALATEEEHPRAKLLSESLQLLIKRPQLIEKVTFAARIRTPGFKKRSGPTVNDYRESGYEVAELVGDAVPLIESSIVFGAFNLDSRIAVFALARFKNARSIPVVVESMRSRASNRDNQVAVAALKEFGDAGIEAAKKVPRANPKLANFRGRASRSRGATQIMIETKQPKGIPEIVAALSDVYDLNQNPPAETYVTWQQRSMRYLKMVSGVKDERLLDPLLRFAYHRDVVLATPAFYALRHYKDERIAKAAVSALITTNRPGGSHALDNLVRLRGEHAATDLCAAEESAKSAHESGNAVVTLYELFDRKLLKKTRQLDFARTHARSLLIAKLIDKDLPSQVAAAQALSNFGVKDPLIHQKLCEWVAKQTTLPHDVLTYMAHGRDATAGKCLLATYKNGDRKDSKVAWALGMLRYQPALSDLKIGLEHKLQNFTIYRPTEIAAIANLGDAGLNEIRQLLRSDAPLMIRSYAAETLSSHPRNDAFDDTSTLFQEVVAQDETLKELVHRDLSQVLWRLATSLNRMDHERGKAAISHAILTLEDDDIITRLAETVRN